MSPVHRALRGLSQAVKHRERRCHSLKVRRRGPGAEATGLSQTKPSGLKAARRSRELLAERRAGYPHAGTGPSLMIQFQAHIKEHLKWVIIVGGLYQQHGEQTTPARYPAGGPVRDAEYGRGHGRPPYHSFVSGTSIHSPSLGLAHCLNSACSAMVASPVSVLMRRQLMTEYLPRSEMLPIRTALAPDRRPSF